MGTDIKQLKIWIQKEIKSLSSVEHSEIFNMIRNDTDRFTENPNGVFINLKNLSEPTLLKIRDFIVFRKEHAMSNNDSQRFQSFEKKMAPSRPSYYSAYQNKQKKSEDNFTFQNYIDKLSITNIKSFPKNGDSEKIVYPALKTVKCKFSGVKARLLKRCKEINRAPIEVSICNNIQNENTKTNTRYCDGSGGSEEDMEDMEDNDDIYRSDNEEDSIEHPEDSEEELSYDDDTTRCLQGEREEDANKKKSAIFKANTMNDSDYSFSDSENDSDDDSFEN